MEIFHYLVTKGDIYQARLLKEKWMPSTLCVFSVCEKAVAAQTSLGWVSTVSTVRGNGEATVGGFYMKDFLTFDHFRLVTYLSIYCIFEYLYLRRVKIKYLDILLKGSEKLAKYLPTCLLKKYPFVSFEKYLGIKWI